jgi:hypothetical protein
VREVFVLVSSRRFETLETSGCRATVHLGPEKPEEATPTAPVVDITFLATRGQLDWLRAGKPVRLTLEPFVPGEA